EGLLSVRAALVAVRRRREFALVGSCGEGRGALLGRGAGGVRQGRGLLRRVGVVRCAGVGLRWRDPGDGGRGRDRDALDHAAGRMFGGLLLLTGVFRGGAASPDRGGEGEVELVLVFALWGGGPYGHVARFRPAARAVVGGVLGMGADDGWRGLGWGAALVGGSRLGALLGRG